MILIYSLLNKRNRLIVLFSPLFIIGIVHTIAYLSYQYNPQYFWMVTAFAYWIFMSLIIFFFASKQSFREWFKKPISKPTWFIVGILTGLAPVLGILLPNLNLLVEYPVIALYLVLYGHRLVINSI